MKYFLFCPGPVNIDEKIKKVILKYDIGHREKEFSFILEKLNIKLCNLVNIIDINKYQTIFITGSSTSANEALISSTLEKNTKVLVLINGEFGERLFNISKLYSNKVYKLDFGWGKEINLEEVEKFLSHNSIDVLFMVHHETSTGMINPIDKIGAFSKRYNFCFNVDAVSSIGAEEIYMEKWNIDFLVGTSGKAIGGFPGFSFIIGKKENFEKLKNKKPKNFYLNLYNYYKYFIELKQTPNTPSVYSFVILYEALKKIFRKGKEKYYQLIKKRALRLRKFFKRLGFRFLIPEDKMSSVLTTIYCPENISIKEIKKRLRKKRIIIYDGKGPLKNLVFQVANIGDLKEKDINYFIKSFKEIIKK